MKGNAQTVIYTAKIKGGNINMVIDLTNPRNSIVLREIIPGDTFKLPLADSPLYLRVFIKDNYASVIATAINLEDGSFALIDLDSRVIPIQTKVILNE